MQITEIHVDFKATVSDGNYGNETYTVAFTATVLEGEGEQSAVAHLAGLAREHVYAALKHSPRDGIREALETEEERLARYERQRQEREARYARQRAESLARAQREQVSDDEAEEDSDDEDDEGSPF